MMPIPQKRKRGEQLAAVAIGLFGLAAAWLGVINPVQSWFVARQDLLEQRREQLVRMRDLAESFPMIQAASAIQRIHGLEKSSAMLPGESDAVAAAFLQQQVQTIAANAGASLRAVETLPSTTVAGRWHRITLRISLDAPWAVLITLVRSVEQLPTRILLDDVNLRNAVAANPSPEKPVQASMTLYGLRPAGTAENRVTAAVDDNS
jgi:hypothetical protein